MLAPRTVFLNHGSFGACPRAILRLQSELRQAMEAEPVQFLWRRYEERLEPSRQTVARFLGMKPKDMVFVTNATAGVNAVVRSARLKRGDEVITTCLDYNACRNVLAVACNETGARLIVADVPFPVSSEDEIVEAVMRVVTARTRIAMIDHVTSNSGIVLPLARLVNELQGRGVDVLVDGAHAPGMLDLNVPKVGAAYYTGNLHKWVCAPKGAAFLWAREDKQMDLMPAVVSHGVNTPRKAYTPYQDRFDWAGTFDPTPWICAGRAVEFMGELLSGGWKELRERNRELALRSRELLCRHFGVEPPCPDKMIGSLATVPLPAWLQNRPRTGKIDAEQLRLYDEHRVEVPFGRCGNPERRYLRVSAQIYNRIEDVEYLAEAMGKLERRS